MFTYFIYTISPLLIASLIYLSTHKTVNSVGNRKIYIFLCGIVMALFIGLRHYENGSGDSEFYYLLWKTTSEISMSNLPSFLESLDMENGFLITVWFFSKVFPPPQFIFILSGVFFAISVCKFVERNCDDVMLGLLTFNCLGLFGFMVQGMRQAIAMCICLYAIEFCKKRDLFRFLFLILLAMAFHASAIVFLAAYIIPYFRLNAKGLFAFSVLSYVGMMLLPDIIVMVNYVINDHYAITGGVKDGSGIVTILIYISVILFALAFRDSKKSKREYAMFFYMTIIAMLSMLMRNTVSAIIVRVGYYFAFGQIILISNSIVNVKEQKMRLVVYVMVIVLIVCVSIHKATYTPLVPYKFFWQ